MTLTKFNPGPVIIPGDTPYIETSESLDPSQVQTTSILTTSSHSESTTTTENTVSLTSSAGGTSAPATRHSQAKVISNPTTSSSPSETSSHSHQPQHTPTIIGAVLGPIVFFLLLAFLLRRLRKTQSSAKLSPNPVLLRRSSSSQSARKSGRQLTEPSDENPPEPLSESEVVQEGDQIPPEEDIPHAGTSSSPRAMNDEAVAEILRLSTQIQQLLTERASVWHPDTDDPPPAYVEEGTEDVSR
ncbi:hypothetical protein EDD85DRAFT_958536 [Armillaria nabsnona]|nr:hypothetical protein EDD85DRAFT_958536 [Armillaria nabsnona]